MTTSTTSRLRVLIADDHPMMRHGLRSVITGEQDLELVGEAGSGGEAIDLYRQLRPDVVLMDLQMAGVDGLAAIEVLRSEFPDARIVVLTSYAGDARISRALALGARSYLLKAAGMEEILRAVRGAVRGDITLSGEAAAQLDDHAAKERLTSREIAVLRLVARGERNVDIARTLSVSGETIKSRMRNILGKLGARDRAHAVVIAIERGYLER